MNLETDLLVVGDPDIRALTAAFLTGHGDIVHVAEDAAAMRVALRWRVSALSCAAFRSAGNDHHD